MVWEGRVGPATLGHGWKQVEQACVFWLLQATLQLVLHDADELFVAEIAIAVLVKDGEDHFYDVVWQVNPGADLSHVFEGRRVDWGPSQVVKTKGLKCRAMFTASLFE